MWNNAHYQLMLMTCSADLEFKKRTPEQYLEELRQRVEAEDYEGAKAITEVLQSRGINTD